MNARGCGIVLAMCGLVACTLAPVRRGPPPKGYAETTPPPGEFPNWPAHPEKFEDLLLNHEYTIDEWKDAGAGTTGAKKVKLTFASANVTLSAKWKPMSGRGSPLVESLDGINNSPRKELAAWKIQSLVLDPEDYVVPSTVAYCMPIDLVTRYTPDAKPTLHGTQCVLGVAALWLQELTLPDPLLDPERFNRDYVYAYYLSNLNLLTYLVKHHDGRDGNFLISNDDSRRQVFAIDNGVAFGGLGYNWFVANWNSIRVPAFRKESIDRLRGLREEDFEQSLGVVAQLELNDAGLYVNAKPTTNLDPDHGVRIQDGILQFGLTEDEIEHVWKRIEDLIEDVDDGDIAVF